ncbi:hypothetical protein Tco_1167971 [Tanacetum coccineum]
MYLVEQCARKVAPIRSPTGIEAGLGEHLAPMEGPDKIPIEDRGGFKAWFANRVWGWRVVAPPQTRPIAIPKRACISKPSFTGRLNVKRQIGVPVKLVDSDYGPKNVKSKKNTKSKALNDKIVRGEGLEIEKGDNLGNENIGQTGCNGEGVDKNRVLNEKKNRIADDEETRLDQSTMDAGDVPVNTSDTNNVTVEKKEFKSAYASIAKSTSLDNKLTLIPIEICECWFQLNGSFISLDKSKQLD